MTIIFGALTPLNRQPTLSGPLFSGKGSIKQVAQSFSPLKKKEPHQRHPVIAWVKMALGLIKEGRAEIKLAKRQAKSANTSRAL